MNTYYTILKLTLNFSFFLEFHAFDYKTSQDTEITPETSGDMNTAIITSEITDIAAETSGTTSVKIYGAMTFEEFKVFKLSEHILIV